MKLTINNNVFNRITQKLARLWRPGRVGRIGCAAALVIAGIVLGGCGGVGLLPGEDPPAPPPPAPTRVVLLDVSGSTGPARSAYLADFASATREIALQQGTMHVILLAGDPLAESRPLSVTFSTEEEGDFAKADLINQGNIVVEQVANLLDKPPIKNCKTALLRAFVLASREIERTEGPLEVVVYSDGIETVDLKMMSRKELDDAATRTTLDRLEEDGLLPATLSGVKVRWILPGHHPGGLERIDLLQVERFWTEAWAQRTGAKVIWG